MIDDADTIQHAINALSCWPWAGDPPAVRDAALAAFGRVVAERDELRARLQRSDAEVSSLRVAWTYAHISSPDAQEQDPGGASGASSTAAIPGPDPGACPECGGWRKAGLTHECQSDDEAREAFFAAMDRLGTSTGSRDLWRDTASGRGGIVESLRARAVRAEARVAPLEAALRAIEREAAESLAAYEACPRGYGYDWEAGQADGLRKAADIARAALVGDSPPAPRAPITGSGIDF